MNEYNYKSEPPRYEQSSHEGGWWYVYSTPEPHWYRVRVIDAADDTVHESTPYDPACGACWLGYGHSGAYHRQELARKQEAR